jgi:hypothetical protein
MNQTMLIRTIIGVTALFVLTTRASAQQGYEFEVYNAKISAPGTRELEIHTNFVPTGSQLVDDAEGRATHRAFRSNLELSTGVTGWLEASVYTVGYARNGAGLQYVGNRLRVTAVVPRWNLPFDVGVAQEIGYARPGFAENRWAYEITPILAKELGRMSLVFNPAFERGLGTNAEHEWEFEPRAELGYALGHEESVGLEYYSVLGPVDSFDARSHQRHQLFAIGKTELPSGLEGSLGIGRGLTRNSDRWVISTKLEVKF